MSAPTVLYSAHDLARLFWVESCTVSNWSKRYADAPPPDFVTTGGKKYWLSLDDWKVWYARRWPDRKVA